ncbi:signal peptidase I [Aeromicrobium panaciterrae]|uniref:Signal peptidase I n=1 Tax=Aeromicrobium panaciterrae TaxID=363861 RepID=A0ABU1UNL7_9ACTN|nr:signal peptidase I [Aeromicrobium panaciterrae]MDR7086720.1 signal peptidase I [Aeromicrobium panaciterrae]
MAERAPNIFSRLRDWRPSRSTPISLAAFLGLVCVLATAVVALFDLTPIVVRSDSMAPEINRGDLVIARGASAGEVAVGDVISVENRAGERVTHRVETVDPYGSSIQFTLKGDANAVPDSQVYNETSIDKVLWTVPKLGYPLRVAIGPVGIFVGGLLVAALAWVVSGPWRRAASEF